ncbi:MAG: mandelate racemase/muconate lactonizing enzyme family protein, partial [Oscillospiraceae bacterium]|nr:mandelate racemase/muconate lactonizing enzyme family protein [Oscillospiraceae bacterium]
MKITKVEHFLFHCDTFAPAKPVGIRVYTDEGIYGDGEASMSYGNGAEGAYGMLESLIPLVLGMNPLANEVIWDKLHKTTFWGQSPGPAVFSAMSAIDIALWDIKGKYYNTPLYNLFGGKFRD